MFFQLYKHTVRKFYFYFLIKTNNKWGSALSPSIGPLPI